MRGGVESAKFYEWGAKMPTNPGDLMPTVLDLMGQVRLGEPTATLRQKVKQLVEAGNSRIILDLEDVTYIDSVGLSTLVASHNAAFSAACYRGFLDGSNSRRCDSAF
jgi:hypothetical protein